MGVFKKLFGIKEPDIPTPATPAPQGVDETDQESVDTKGGGLRKRKARGKRDLHGLCRQHLVPGRHRRGLFSAS